MSGIRTFEPYAVNPSMAVVCRDVDDTVSEVTVLRRDNARLRRENQGLATDWADSNNELAGLRDALTAAVGVYDCPCGSMWEFADGLGIEDYAALHRWLGRHNSCTANLAAAQGRTK
jgi:hypothetical protein